MDIRAFNVRREMREINTGVHVKERVFNLFPLYAGAKTANMIKIGQLSRVLVGFGRRATQTTRVLSRQFSLSVSRQQTLDAAAANKKARFELAASYRGMEKYNFHEAVCNHLSVVCPAANGQGEVMLLIPYGLHWKEVSDNPCMLAVDFGSGNLGLSSLC